MTADQVLAQVRLLHLGEKEGVCAKAKFQHNLAPGKLLTFLPIYSLHNRLLEIL